MVMPLSPASRRSARSKAAQIAATKKICVATAFHRKPTSDQAAALSVKRRHLASLRGLQHRLPHLPLFPVLGNDRLGRGMPIQNGLALCLIGGVKHLPFPGMPLPLRRVELCQHRSL